MMRALVVIGAMGLAACAGPESSEGEVRWLGYDEFVGTVQPILARACGNPACHGRPERPFAIFSAEQWRSDDSRLFLDEPLTVEELEHNYTAACVFSSEVDRPEDALLLQKPLGSYGPMFHGGGDVFLGVSDRDYRKVLQWIQAGW